MAAGGVVELSALAKLTVDRASSLLGLDSAGLYWLDASATLIALADNDPEATRRDLQPGEGIVGQAIREGRPVVVEDYQQSEQHVPSVAAHDIQAGAAVPILVGERTRGALVVYSKVPHHFDAQDLQTLALLGAQVAPVIEVARLYAESERRRAEAEALASRAATALERARANVQESRRVDELAQSEASIRALYEAVGCGVLMLDPSGIITHANSAAEEMLGTSLAQMRGRTPTSLWRAVADDGSDLPSHERPAEIARQTTAPVRQVNMGLVKPDGELRWYQIDAVPVLDRLGNLTQVVSSLIDITEHKRVEEALQHQALHDALTSLPNRTLLYDRLAQAIRVASRDRTPLALLNIDLDGFKEVNDTLGHRVGDILLQHVGERLREGLREPDTVARTGGDEFAVLLPGADRSGATLVARKLLHALQQPCLIEDESIPVGGSIGIALHPDNGTDAETLMRRADVAMYEAKRSASGYALYTPAQEQRSNLRRVVVAELRQAIEQNQLSLRFQPKLEIKTGHVAGVEILVRWEHPEGILIPPERFIPLAEQTGLIEPLTWWVLNATLRQLREWQGLDIDVPIALNLSTRTLHDPELPNHIAFLTRMWHIAEDAITLEITESAVMANPARAAKMLQGLRAMGLHIAIDDFGTGYSSLSSLGRLPIEEIKVDRSFVRTMVADPQDAAIVRAAIDLGHQLGLRVVAEGVEDRATSDLLDALGCDQAQGHYFTPPLSAIETVRWLQQRADGTVSAEG